MRNKPEKKDESLLYGKLPPQAIEMEEAVIGACMLEKETFEALQGIIKNSRYFYKPEHELIWEAMIELFASGTSVDLLTISDKLRKMGKLEQIGGAYYLTMLCQAVMSSAHAETHAMIIAEKYIARETIRATATSTAKAYDETLDIFSTIETAMTSLGALQSGSITQMPKSALTLSMEHKDRIAELQNKNMSLSGVPTGFPTLDEFTSGWQKKDFIILAARPSVGKTAFSLNLAMNAAKAGTADAKFPVAFFSLEMGSLSLVSRGISSIGKISLYKLIQANRMSQNDMRDYVGAADAFSKLDLHIDEQPRLTVSELRAKARVLQKKYGIKLIIIDYLQLMKGTESKNSNREQEISGISGDLKAMAKDLDLPVIALSQLSRGSEYRKESKVPQLTDLRESGAIEQDADIVMFLYRPEYHGQKNDEMGEIEEGLTEIHFAKHRNGDLGKIPMIFQKEYQLFVDKEANSFPDNPAAGINKPLEFGGSRMFIPGGLQIRNPSEANDKEPWD